MKFLWFHIILSLSLSGFLRAQEYSYYNFNELYNFDVETIYDIDQDKFGDFWFGTNQGLVHFNGRDFRKFSSKNYSKDVTNIKFDDFGRVWCSNFGGQIFYLQNDSLHTAINKTPSIGYIKNYFPYKEDSVFILSDKGNSLYLANIQNQEIAVAWSFSKTGWITDFFKNDQGFVILTQERDSDETKVILKQFILNPESLSHELINKNSATYSSPAQFTSLYKDSLLHTICTKKGITCYNFDRTEPIIFKKEATSFDINNVVIHNNEVFALRKTNVSSFSLTPPYRENVVISHKNASCLFEDQENNLWFGTLDDGIFVVPNLAIRETLLSKEKIKSTIYTRQKDLYFITDQGSFCHSQYPYLKYDIISQGFTPSEGMVYDPLVETIFFTNHPQVFDINQQRLKAKKGYEFFKDIHFLTPNVYITTNGQAAILQTKDKSPIPSKQLLRYNVTGARTAANINNPDRIYLRDVRSLHIVEEPDKKHLYINFIDGVYLYTSNKTPQKLTFQNTPLLASTMIEDEKIGIWIATNNGYILKFEKGKRVYEKKISESIYRIAQHGSLLFLYTQNKIYRLDVANNKLSTLDATDGLNPVKVAKLLCHNDSLFIIGESKIQRIACSYEHLNKIQPKVFIDSISLYGESISSEQTLFAYNQNHLSIAFHGLAIRSQQNYTYEYRITDDAKWITLSGRINEVTLQNLEPGNYNFQIRMINEDGVRSGVKSYAFTIDRHFSQKWWFILLVILVLTFIIGLIIKARYRNLQQKNDLKAEQQRLKKEVYKSKIAAIRSQMNPHFMFNALNTIQEFIITNQKEIASEYLADFADLMRKYLEQSKHEEIALHEEIETLEIYLSLENLRSDGQLTYSINCEPTINPYEVTIPVMLLQPFVENAIKHGLLHKSGEKSLSIRFKKVGQKIQCTIEDNGIGREATLKMKKERSHLSFATSAIDQKTELVNKSSNRQISIEVIDLYSEDSSPSGTRVIIQLDI